MTILQPQLGSSKPEEEVARSRLFKIWKHITYTLISSVAVLYKELKAANTSHEPALSDQSSLITNRESNKLNDEFNNNDNDIMMLSADESEVKDEVYDFGIPSSMIDEAADLSHYSHTLPLQSFEELLALEQSLLHRDGQHTELDETLVRSGSISSTHSESAFMAPSPLILPSSNSDQNQWLNSPNIDATLARMLRQRDENNASTTKFGSTKQKVFKQT
ncbi:hypothetical protein HYALB_00001726 [Hymenoscyphus albidus]|uniref:Uncharacterized protein n=1 Tax=Hymenoscyphus albidus TaxID=595503 RepID=A0A9N9LDX5_9HELO|nr:hypothetical protein HYALB_00001726 [Hymenoscyphus albidus]